MVAIKDDQKFTFSDFHGRIQVTGLGVAVIRTNQVMHAYLGGKLAKGLSLAVIKDIDVQLIPWPVNA
jgi:hypothetical protein